MLVFLNGQLVSTLRNRAQASDGLRLLLTYCVSSLRKQPFLLAIWDVSPGETSAPERKKSIVIIPTRLLCQMQAKSSGAEFLTSNPSLDWLLFCLLNVLLFLMFSSLSPRGIVTELKQQRP